MKAILLSLLIMFIIVNFSCFNDYNPYNDVTNANAIIERKYNSGLRAGDTIEIFSTDTITVTVTVRNLIDSFTVFAGGNRFWAETTIVAPQYPFYKFPVSFNDSGEKKCSIITYRQGDEPSSSAELVLFAVSPLLQKDVYAHLGTTIDLLTPAVKDDSVWYHWAIGDELITDTVHSLVEQKSWPFSRAGFFMGKVWVSTDAMGKVAASSGASFAFVLNDDVPPLIINKNSNVTGDTIRTSLNPFYLEMHITDLGNVDVVAIDYDRNPIKVGNSYIKKFTGVDSFVTVPKPIYVYARDYQQNDTATTYYLLFDTSITAEYQTRFSIDSLKEHTVGYAVVDIRGQVIDHINDSLYLQSSVNGRGYGRASLITLKDGNALWEKRDTLDEGLNTFRVQIVNHNGLVLGTDSIEIFYNPDIPDVKSPTIWAVKLNGIDVVQNTNNYITDSTAELSFSITDENGLEDVDFLRWQSEQLITMNKGQRDWVISLSNILHKDSTLFTIQATDSSNNTARYSFLLRRNSMPLISQERPLPIRYVVDQSDSDMVLLIVEDIDRVTASINGAPGNMVLMSLPEANKWSIHYTPAIADTGLYTVAIVLNDGYQDTVVNWVFPVIQDTSLLVRFNAEELLLPHYLQVGDSIVDTIYLAKNTGQKPFTYTTLFMDSKKKILDTTTDSSLVAIRWIASEEDIGNQHVMLTVADALGDGDTLYRDVEVIKRNSDPCSLVIAATIDEPEGALAVVDMRYQTSAKELQFVIMDDDHPYTEKYTVSIETYYQRTGFTLDTTKLFSVEVKPFSDRAIDTLKVTVEDNTGTKDTILIQLLYHVAIPPNEVEGFTVWFDASEGVQSSSSGSSLKYWNAKNDPTIQLQVINSNVSSTMMRIRDNIANGRPAIDFSSGGQLYNANSVELTEWAHDSFTVIIVAKFDGVERSKNFAPLISYGYLDFGLGVSSNNLVAAREQSEQTSWKTINKETNLVVEKNVWAIYTFMSSGFTDDGCDISVWLSGQAAANDISFLKNVNNEKIVLGSLISEFNDSPIWNGAVAEVVLFNRTLLPIDRQGVEMYLADRYGIKIQ